VNPWLVLAGVVAWTAATAYFAHDYGQAQAERACQEAKDKAAKDQRKKESEHAAAARQFEEDRKHDQANITMLQGELEALGASEPTACRLGASRRLLWNRTNADAGAAVPGEPARQVRDAVPAPPVR
jgi:hypothetical protein